MVMARQIDRAPSLADRVAEALSAEIAGGRYAPGSALPSEAAMAEAFGVSRTVMREAISRLKGDGLVITRQGLGAFVAAVRPPQVFRIDPSAYGNRSEILNIVELRMGFEVEAAALAAQRRTEADLKKLRQAFADMQACHENVDLARGVEADVKFHRAISEATHSRYYPDFFASLSQFLLENIAQSRSLSSRAGRAERAQAEHRAILDAIADRDERAARAAMRRHLEGTAARLREDADVASVAEHRNVRRRAAR